MRLQISKSKNAESFYVVKSVYVDGKRTNKVHKKLGTYVELKAKLGTEDPYEWAKNYVKELNRLEEEGKEPEVIAKYSPHKVIDKDKQRSFNIGYLFLQKIYHQLGLDKVCREISKKYKFEYDLNSIFSRLIYSRILAPSSKLSTFEYASRFLEQPNFDLHQIYRGLEVIAQESKFIQSRIYENSITFSKRNTAILYYDCTNYFFEIEQSDGLKQYGVSKDHKPNPIVQMGLFIDGDGVPLAFNISDGNTNEQLTLRPLEETILNDFKLSKFVVCTDAGLASLSNRKYNDRGNRAFVTTQSIKKLKKFLRDWALDPKGWRLTNSLAAYNLQEIDESKHYDSIFYKERWIKEDGLEQRLIITYSIKYRNYTRGIRNSHISRAINLISKHPAAVNASRSTDYKRFVKKTSITGDGEVAERNLFAIDEDLIEKEAMYDGFYAVCTNLEDNAQTIANINKQRWKIEECFRILKSEFKARPVYLQRDDRITAHFTTCFVSLVIYRLLEKKLKEQFTCSTIIDTLKEMDVKEVSGEGYEPIYTRTDFTDTLHEIYGFRTDYEITTLKQIKKIMRETKKQ